MYMQLIQGIRSWFGRVQQFPQQDSELARLNQMKVRTTHQGIQTLKAAARGNRSSACTALTHWCTAGRKVIEPNSSIPKARPALAARTIVSSGNEAPEQSLQELLQMGCDHFSTNK